MVGMSRAASSAEVDRFFAEAVRSRPGARDEPLFTDFAITTIDIPDRLDAQSIRTLQSENYRRASRFSVSRSAVEIWLRRLLWIALVGALGALAWLGVETVRAQIGKEAIASRIAAATGLPVTIAERELVWLPTPGINLRDLRIGSGIRADQVEIRYSWDGLAQAVSRRRLLPEATVAPMQLTAEQAIAVVRVGSMMRSDSGLGLGAVRFSAVTFRDMPLLPEQYEIVLQHQSVGIAAPLELRQLGGRGEMRLFAFPDGEGALRFDLNAQRWAAPVGPAVAWDSLVAQGRAWPRGIVVESFTGKTASAQVDGAWVAASDVQWSAAGSLQSVNADLEGVLRALAGSADDTAFRSPLRGRASFSALGSGHGASLTAAVDRSVFVGEAQARSLTLAGINLGMLAAQEAGVQAAGGTTRFSELTADLLWTPGGLSIRDIRGQSGGMLTRGQIAVSPNLRIAGSLTVDLSAVLPQAPPAVLQLGGTLTNPYFSRP
jgi:hypothetical protein